MQTELQFTTPHDLERFNIPRSCTDIRYGHVSRHLNLLWKTGKRGVAAELAAVAGEVFNEPYWAKRYPAQLQGEPKP